MAGTENVLISPLTARWHSSVSWKWLRWRPAATQRKSRWTVAGKSPLLRVPLSMSRLFVSSLGCYRDKLVLCLREPFKSTESSKLNCFIPHGRKCALTGTLQRSYSVRLLVRKYLPLPTKIVNDLRCQKECLRERSSVQEAFPPLCYRKPTRGRTERNSETLNTVSMW